MNTLVIFLLVVGCQGFQEYADSAAWIWHCTPGILAALLLYACVFFGGWGVVLLASSTLPQVNLEFLGRVVFSDEELIYLDSVVGTDSHTTMINGLGILGWGESQHYVSSF